MLCMIIYTRTHHHDDPYERVWELNNSNAASLSDLHMEYKHLIIRFFFLFLFSFSLCLLNIFFFVRFVYLFVFIWLYACVCVWLTECIYMYVRMYESLLFGYRIERERERFFFRCIKIGSMWRLCMCFSHIVAVVVVVVDAVVVVLR